MALIIACVKVGRDVYAAEHVNKLYQMVTQNLDETTEGRFVCFTDDPEGINPEIQTIPVPKEPSLSGWWAKLYMFSQSFGAENQVLYFDLDTVITGSLDEIASCRERFAVCSDFYRSIEGKPCLQSCVMSWNGDFGPDEIWKPWDEAGRPHLLGGDQAWIEELVLTRQLPKPTQLDRLYPRQIVSYKRDCRPICGLPVKAAVVNFHGRPKPWDAPDSWVDLIYNQGKTLSSELRLMFNTDIERIEANIRHNSLQGHEWLSQREADGSMCAIVGGGPSIEDTEDAIRALYDSGVPIIALNNAAVWLQERGIIPSGHVILDARDINLRFIEASKAKTFYIASQADPQLFEAAKRKGRVVLWHQVIPGLDAFLPAEKPSHCLICAGSTVGLAAVAIAFSQGVRTAHLFGYDSSLRDDAHHAYEQPENDKIRIIEATVDGATYRAQPWMASQATEFQLMASDLANNGMGIVVHGDGLLPHCARLMAQRAEQDAYVKIGEIWYPTHDQEQLKYGAEASLSVDRLLFHTIGRKVVVQAGACVGLFPRLLAAHFDEVYTFEPDDENFECLTRNCAGIENIRYQKAVLGPDLSTASLNRVEGSCGSHHVCGAGDIPMATIDSLKLDACDLIALDIEGYERHALEGAVETIKRFRPVIVCEDKGLSERYGHKTGAVAEFLAQYGYGEVDHIGRDVVFSPEPDTHYSVGTLGAKQPQLVGV